MNLPENLKYSKEHEWGKIEGNTIRIGITDYAQAELGDVVFIDLPETGTKVEQDVAFGTVESVKAVSDIYSPVSGTIIETNSDLLDSPELINEDCYGLAWMVVIEMDNPNEADLLMDADAYEDFLASEAK